jgi:hypothetical protein
MTMSDHPLFMSSRHIDILNRRAVESEAITRLCSGLERDLCLVYELHDGPDGGNVYWRTDFTRAGGVCFSLARGAGIVDVLVAGDFWDVIAAVQGKGLMPAPRGDADAIEEVRTLLTSAEIRTCAVQVHFPTRPGA